MEGTRIPIQHGMASPKNPRGFLNCSKTERTDQSSFRLHPQIEAIAIFMSVPAIRAATAAHSQGVALWVFDPSSVFRSFFGGWQRDHR